ncbi:heavy metal translocating P-type ATPase [Actinosynnema pretiosum]|uniref:Cadmium-translocating P-type ATPase n=1 Tax=Actinosynnema pretiosum TaxID=42197 RepID=A0A290Z973_9PSEU|nr:heavy metal translocating P-type ATPase [Actinosynnema pretiosum]ATE55535.1 cadmium-translocating P-type ATPase [Actinosynnema pretiosum]
MTTVAPERPTTRAPARRTRWTALPEARWAALSLALFLTALAVQLADGPEPVRWALSLACCAAGGWEPGLSGLRALRERTLDVDLLMVVAAIGAVSIGQVLDGALLIVIFATSGALEALATARTEDSVRGLLDLAPDTATRVGDGAEEVVRVADLEVGDVVLVRPGELVPADGVVVAGAGEVDQATITGEPLPVDKAEGDEVFAGTLNGTGALRVRVGKRAADSVVARIAAAVEEASRTKARTQLFIEKVEQRYSIGMVVATLVIFTAPLLWGEPVREALLRAMTFMIVASPCALVLATMPPLLAAIANAGRHGVLVKSAVVVERLASADRVAFDKTGTLTRGEPEVAGLRALPGAGLDEDALLRLAASAEHPSEHPLGRAVVRAARERGLDVPQAREFSARPGRGVTARVGDRVVEIGSPEALGGAGIEAVDGFLARGHTAVLVLVDGEPAGVLAIADRVRPEAEAAVAALTAATGAAPVLLTGDNRRTADRLAGLVGISDVRAGLLPEDKAEAVRALQAEGRRVVVVGDGVNDAPALAVAHAGVAMGVSGADLALRTADAVVVRDDLSTIPAAIALARRAKRVVVANLVIAGSFVVVLVAWDLLGDLPLPLGVAGHEGSTVIVGLNGLRLLREAAWRKAKG